MYLSYPLPSDSSDGQIAERS